MQQLPSVHIVYSTTTEEHLTENFTTHAVLGEEKKKKRKRSSNINYNDTNGHVYISC